MLIVAPHPDDDVIAAGGLIQRTIAAGGALRILLLTAGERNEWAQRAYLRKWRITPADRVQWAAVRMAEAAEALARLGAPAPSLELLGFGDRGLPALARSGDGSVTSAIAQRVRLFRPTLAVLPSTFDLHGDHRATAYLAHRAIDDPMLRIVTYVIHGTVPAARAVLTLELSPAEQARKRSAIEAHQTQLVLGRGRFTGYARTKEIFLDSEEDQVRLPSEARDVLDAFRHGASAVANSVIGYVRRLVP